MKHPFNRSIFVLIFLVSVFASSFAQLPWTKDPNNPVMSGGASGTWNRHLYWPSVLYNTDSVRYEMWYSGSSGSPTRPMNIGFATSPDGVSWTHNGQPVLAPGTGGSWDDSSVEIPWVILEDSVYKMWYSGWNSSNQEWSVGYATSPDGINWTKDTLNNPVMTQGPAAWEAGGIVAGSILYNVDSARYDMWYSGYTGAFIGNIGYATSPDGINWTKYSGNPVLTNGGSGTWDEDSNDIPRVLYYDNLYHMWFTGIPDSYNIPWQIGWATSVDGIHWNKYNDPNTTTQFYSESDPVLSPDNNQWDGSRLQVGTVIRAGDSLHFWYTGVLNPSATNLWRIGHATAPVDPALGIRQTDNFAKEIYLLQNYPNPFNPTTTIEFSIPKTEFVTLKVYNLLGQEVVSMVDQKLTPGNYNYDWNASRFASGIYYYTLEAGLFIQTKKLILLK